MRAAYHTDKLLSNKRIYQVDKLPEDPAMPRVQPVEVTRLENTRELIAQAGGPTAAAKLLDMDTSQLSQIAGRNPTRAIGSAVARRIELAFSKPKGWLDVSHVQFILRDGSVDQNVEYGPDLRSEVPLISWVQAGKWREVIDNLQRGDAERWIPTHARVGRHAYALRIVGDSMVNPRGSPSFPEGTVIIVDPERSAEPGRFVVVRQNHNTECTFKQLVRDAGRFYLKPLNPQYQIMELAQDAVVCGVLVQSTMDF